VGGEGRWADRGGEAWSAGELNEIRRSVTDCCDKSRPLRADGGVATIVAGTTAVGTELMIRGERGPLGRSALGRRGIMGVGGRFVTVHAGLSGIGLGERLANAMLGDGLGRREGSRGERRQEEH
jgi:hypothetical protein